MGIWQKRVVHTLIHAHIMFIVNVIGAITSAVAFEHVTLQDRGEAACEEMFFPTTKSSAIFELLKEIWILEGFEFT